MKFHFDNILNHTEAWQNCHALSRLKRNEQ